MPDMLVKLYELESPGDVFERDIAPLLTKQKRTKRSELDDEWEPSPELKEDINQKLGVTIDHESETDKFRNHHLSKGNTFKRPDLAYRKWCRQAVDWGTANKGSGSSSRHQRPGAKHHMGSA